ncbi:MAG: type III pantothenate kinase [Bacteroidales bacterium]|nr:type III pantothenate kinase [Bacteroidales bacterium]
MDLIVDAGNTTLKLYAFESNVIQFQLALPYDDFFKDKSLYASFLSAERGILCNVSKYASTEIINMCNPVVFFEFTHNVDCPISNAYKTPQTLGLDRLAAAIGAESLYPCCNKLIIDIGTAMTIDFVDAKSTFVGGNISLGLDVRFRALHDYTGKLPLCTAMDSTGLIGQTTIEAINNGVVLGMAYEIDGYINEYLGRYQDVKVFLTGGCAQFFEKRIKNLIFANQNLVALGLNAVLQYVYRKK